MSFGLGAPHDYGCPCERCAARRQMRCKFCGCTDEWPCLSSDGQVCEWLIPNVCTNPACVDKAYEESKRDLVAICGVRL